MNKISIIIPIYNSEQYLEQCLRSAMNQTMRDIEIICVNDGSSDGSLQILKRFSNKDCRIKIINKKNTGYGNTMNKGIDSASGKYLIFLESDDFIKETLCEVLYEICEKYNLDIAKADYYEFKMKGEEVCSRYKRISDYDNYHRILNPKINMELFYASMYTWTCMYKREFIIKNKIRHNETPGASYQDNGFWFQTLMFCERLYLLDQAFYMYRQDNPYSSIYNKGKIYAFSNEYTYIQKKLEAYKGSEKKDFLRICAFFNLHHNIMSLKRVDKRNVEKLLQLIVEEFMAYNKQKVWDVRHLDDLFIKRIMVCMVQPDELKKKIWIYKEKEFIRNEILKNYNTFILYGAGVYAKRLLEELEKCKMWNKDIYCGVTETSGVDQNISGIKIKEIKKLLKYDEKGLVILCAKKDSENYKQMHHNLEMWGVRNVVHSEDLIVESFWKEFNC